MSALETARGLIEVRYADGGLDPRNDGTDLVIHSAAMATLALAEEQRTANLIALLASEGAWSRIGRERADALGAEIVARLGLKPPPVSENPWASA